MLLNPAYWMVGRNGMPIATVCVCMCVCVCVCVCVPLFKLIIITVKKQFSDDVKDVIPFPFREITLSRT